jgi:hypothetical protein
LGYSITSADNASGDIAPANGTVSLSEIVPDFFELSMVSPAGVVGGRHVARVRAIHPATSRPVAGVKVESVIKHDYMDEPGPKASGITGTDGYASLEFMLPAELKAGSAGLEVTGSLHGISRHLKTELYFDRSPRITLTTDKRLYQPGQTLHIRALAQDPGKRAIRNLRLRLKVEDPEGNVAYREEITTSRFGIAAADWSVPATARLGDYEISLDRDEDEPYAWRPSYVIKVSRYELPNFTVTLKPDRGYYLPGQNAVVEVRADYLFGQPVTRGRARVVRETSRDWNYREQKWDIEEGDSYEGEIDDKGVFKAQINLGKDHSRVSENDYRRFEDVSLAAYVTDATTGRTEQRRFDLRVTREAIHVYPIDGHRGTESKPYFYVSTSYADGTPAQCDVSVSTEERDSSTGASKDGRFISRVRTNRYGVARVNDSSRAAAGHYRNVRLSARDSKGLTGHGSHEIWVSDESVLRMATAKTLHRPGEPVEVEISSDPPAASAFIDVGQDWKPLRSQTINLTNGKARVALPYTPEFNGAVSIVAYTQDADGRWNQASRAVFYPRDEQLKLNFKASRDEYKPGDEAAVEFEVLTAEKKPVASVLGVTVKDQAIEERERTDRDFGGPSGFFYWYCRTWGRTEELGGVTRASLQQLDLSKPIPEGLDLVAEILLRDDGYWLREDHTESPTDPGTVFSVSLNRQLLPIRRALDTRYNRTGEYPTTVEMLQKALGDSGIALDKLRDPWGTAYLSRFSLQQNKHVLDLMSAGPDERVGTRDDFSALNVSWLYFKPHGDRINRAVREYHRRTGGYIRDAATLKRELQLLWLNLDSIRDPWGRPYQVDFQIEQKQFVIEVMSSGENARFETADVDSDDFTIWKSPIDYTTELRWRIDSALGEYFKTTGRVPQKDEELKEAFQRSRLGEDTLSDPWGHRYYAVFKTNTLYGDRVTIYNYSKFADAVQRKTEVTPVTRRLLSVGVRSAGPDGKEGTPDDFDIAAFSRVIEEFTSTGLLVKPDPSLPPLRAGTGAIEGKVTDQFGALIQNAEVAANTRDGRLVAETKTDSNGRYRLRNLATGDYDVSFNASGFKRAVVAAVPVNKLSVTEVNAILEVGTVSEAVMVTSEATQLQTTVNHAQIADLPVHGRQMRNLVTKTASQDISTPRLREYFPETLVWQPELETDASGRAQLKFKLADNITTWKLSAIASTEDGQVGTVEKDILAFQPFFVDLDPPRVLTQGDQIALPVVLRNYLDKPQTVDLEMTPAPWFKLLDAPRRRSQVQAADSSREVFNFEAVATVDEGKQRVTAAGQEAGDAIEKPVSVHPDGEEIAQSATRIFGDTAGIEMSIPPSAITGTTRAELKIYPNLMTHVLESVEGIMQRPYGCTEQLISSAYPSLLVLQRRKAGAEVPAGLAARAERYVRAGYERLLNSRSSDGGFSYWLRGPRDLALSAYALRFLNAARGVIYVDDEVIEETRDWLVKQQRPDGSWPVIDWDNKENTRRTSLQTAYIARVLATPPVQLRAERVETDTKDDEAGRASVKRALEFLSRKIQEIDEPYLIASYVLAAFNAGNAEWVGVATAKLRELAREEAGSNYWALETNTPFYGWGLAGRVETTALAVQALAAGSANTKDKTSKTLNERLIHNGLTFLLRNKDRYGVWSSTQATINVLDALLAVGGGQEPVDATSGPADISVNGRRVASVEMPAPGKPSGPLSVDLTSFVSRGTNSIEIRRSSGSAQGTAQLVSSHYQPWQPAGSTKDTTPLRLRVSFDKTESKPGEEIKCRVEAERVGFRGYGMMLAEIGLPPGADIDRASLESAINTPESGVYQYDIQPDRLIVYLWPQAGGSKFEFKFKPRFGLAAKTAASVLYDYYNPEARVVLAPALFVVK